MFHRSVFCQFFLLILQLLCWTVEAKWKKLNIPSRFSALTRKEPGAPVLQSKIVSTPESFDAREHWKQCRSVIDHIRNQGRCDSCWAVATASVLSDITCIATNGSLKVFLSAEDLITCCDICLSLNKTSCQGGTYPGDAVYYWIKQGIVTGGEVNSKKASTDRIDQPCVRRCTNKRHWKEYEEDKYRGKMVYELENREDAIRTEIFTHGPVIGIFDIYTDFHGHTGGVYRHKHGTSRGTHAIKILGWGEDSGEKYWLVANTWGAEWGEKGYMKFLRGENHCNVEEYVLAGRMSDVYSSGETIRKTVASGTDRRCSFSMDNLLPFTSLLWILKIINVIKIIKLN